MAANEAIRLHWLNGNTTIPVGTTWGVPWKEGELRRDEQLRLQGEHEDSGIPLQSWAAAYWPDGSVKWSAHAAAFGDAQATGYSLVKGKGPDPVQRVNVTETEETIVLDTGIIVCTLAKHGRSWLRSIVRGDREVCSGGELVCLREESSELTGVRTYREEAFESRMIRATVEQSGPVRAVVKLDGRHRAVSGSREWLPFSMRFSVFAGLDAIRLVHTFFYDGNPHQDFIKGLGIRFTVLMQGPLFNRHVRLSGDSGFFSESPKSLHTRRTTGKYQELHKQQVAGEAIASIRRRTPIFSACWTMRPPGTALSSCSIRPSTIAWRSGQKRAAAG